MTERVADWSARHRKTAVFGWLLLVAAIFVAGQAIGSAQLPQYDPGQAGQAERVLNQVAPAQFGASNESVLIQAKTAGVTFSSSPAMQQAASQVAAALSAQPQYAAGIRGPLSAAGQSLVSKDGRSALVTFEVPGNVTDINQAATTNQHAVATVQARHPDLLIAESGRASIQQAINNASNFGKAEGISIPITLILLLIVFGALVAAGIPLLLGLTSLTAAIGVLTIVSHVIPVFGQVYEVVVIIGMAVGVDYSLFYLRREREERTNGRSFPEALGTASRTSGRTILVSGATVIASVSSLFLVGGGPYAGIAAGTIAVVAIAVLGSLTVLPALLAWLGPWSDAGRIPFLSRWRAAARPSRAWAALARGVVGKPVVWGGLTAIALLALATPTLGLRIGEPPIDAPYNLPAVQTMTEIQQAFPQAPGPAQVVVTGSDVTGPTVAAAVDALRSRTSADGPIRGPVTATSIGGGRALIVNVQLAGNGQDTTSFNALATLRDQDLPATLGKVPGISYAVAGDTAGSHDTIQLVHDNTPIVFAVVAVLAFVVLLAGFRSIMIPAVSILLNLLSVAAAYGLITLIFQDGRLEGPLGYTAFGGITWWVPLFMFVLLFGISMDYHVFILSRIREHWTRGASPRAATVDGIASSAGVVTSAALIMAAVFSIFLTLPFIELKVLGIGMTTAVLIDATVIRGILLPAALSLLGDRAWRLRRDDRGGTGRVAHPRQATGRAETPDRGMSMIRRSWRAGVTGLAALAAVGAVMAPAAPARASRPAAGTPAVPVLHWQACDSSFQCATARVPLDYRQPQGQQIDIAVIRHLATDPAHRAGSLFFNPGGPGGSGTAELTLAYGLFPAQVRARFDIVSFDPRGVPASTAIQCFADDAAENSFLSRAPQGFPVGAKQEATWVRTYAGFDERCVSRGGSLLAHMSTADVARDVDLLRQAVGAAKLNYLGISYGTILGATYANLFPAQAGAMILDGNYDPVAWAEPSGDLPMALRLGTDTSSAATLNAFLDQCGTVPASRCAFSAGSPAATRAKFTAMLSSLHRHPVAIGSPPQLYTYASTVQAVVNFLYTVQPVTAAGFPGWLNGAMLLQQLWQAPPAPAHGQTAAAAAASSPYNGPEQESAVLCGDSPNPHDPHVYDTLARFAYRRSGPVGPYWSWQSELCSQWPATADPYHGPWDRRTANPILVIGNTDDPATPYQDSVAMSRDLPRARLLTVDGYGHTEFLNPSSCAERYETRYLLTGALPPAGTVCQQDKTPFST